MPPMKARHDGRGADRPRAAPLAEPRARDRVLICVPHDRAARRANPYAGAAACATAWMPSYLVNGRCLYEVPLVPRRLRVLLAVASGRRPVGFRRLVGSSAVITGMSVAGPPHHRHPGGKTRASSCATASPVLGDKAQRHPATSRQVLLTGERAGNEEPTASRNRSSCASSPQCAMCLQRSGGGALRTPR